MKKLLALLVVSAVLLAGIVSLSVPPSIAADKDTPTKDKKDKDAPKDKDVPTKDKKADK